MRRVNQRQVRFLPDAAGAALEGRALLSTFTVTNTDDTGTGSLRNAVALANAHNGTDSIRFQSGLTGVISLDSGQLDLTDDVNILGPGARKIALTNPDGRIFETHDVKATIAALSFLGGHADNGGAILQDRGDLTVKDAVFVRNHADNNGGAIDNVGGTFTGRNDRFVANDAGGFGGAFANERGSRTKDDVSSYGLDSKGKDKGHRPRPTPVTTAAFTDSSFVGNNAYDGGALANLDGSSLSVARGSLVLNRSEADGGGIFSGRGDRSKSIDAPDTTDSTDATTTDVAAMTTTPRARATRDLDLRLVKDGWTSPTPSSWPMWPAALGAASPLEIARRSGTTTSTSISPTTAAHSSPSTVSSPRAAIRSWEIRRPSATSFNRSGSPPGAWRDIRSIGRRHDGRRPIFLRAYRNRVNVPSAFCKYSIPPHVTIFPSDTGTLPIPASKYP